MGDDKTLVIYTSIWSSTNNLLRLKMTFAQLITSLLIHVEIFVNFSTIITQLAKIKRSKN